MIEDATEASLLQILTLVRNTVELNQHSLHFMVLTTQCEPRGPHTAKSEQEFILQIVWADDKTQKHTRFMMISQLSTSNRSLNIATVFSNSQF